ncbi:MAG: hypothetical protein JW837_15430 [Sedimentisphaerales bacterium]|nr:hypothetical protein [Sedimentisphaerales bacterium]
MVKSVDNINSSLENTSQNAETEKAEFSELRYISVVVCWAVMLIFTFHACTHMVAAGDTWVAMACGRHFVNHGVDTVEPFSVNSHKPGPTEEEVKTWPDWAQWITEKVGIETVKKWHPTGWINQNWLTHVIFYKLVPKSSYADGISFPSNALVYWKFTVYISTVICVYYTGRLLGAHPWLCAIFSCFAMFAGRSFIDIRPAGFSNMLVAVFLLILALTTYRNALYIWLIVPVTVFWCNVHGGYIYAFIMLFPFVGLLLPTSIHNKKTLILSIAGYLVIVACFGRIIHKSWALIFFMVCAYMILCAFLWYFKGRLISVGQKGLCHIVAAAFVAFVATILFNPLHLTNLTHTFVISVSEHAARWRNIHEWHPAFNWTNPVGTGFPFLVLCVLGAGLLVLWLFSHYLKEVCQKTIKKNVEGQKKKVKTHLTFLSYAGAILVCWILFLVFSFLNYGLADFLLCALFAAILLLSILKSVHFIYLTVLLILLGMWAGANNNGYAGRYIYPFVLLPVYVLLYVLASFLSKSVKIKLKNIIYVALAAVVSLFLITIIFNPFKFEMPIWNVGQFFQLQRVWRPAYESNLELKYANLFNALYFLNIISVLVWFGIPYLKMTFSRTASRADEHSGSEIYQWPKIDMPQIVIAVLTIYMAIRSRRFIPIAAVAACPVIAMLIDQLIRAVSIFINYLKFNHLAVGVVGMGYNLRLFFILAGAMITMYFGVLWGLKFKLVYLDSWPRDPKFTSIFMRMTDSGQKPFYACKFIKDNRLKGNVFNAWTEGGFIAFGEEPDPNTGKIPLQLFMDGRAQAAYDCSAFDLWTEIMAGGQYVTGQILYHARLRERQLTDDDYIKIGKWMDEQLSKYNVWVVLIPQSKYSTPPPSEYYERSSYHAIQGLERNPDWRLVFFNDKQRLYVDTKTPQGKALFDGIFDGKTIYPDEFHGNLIRAHSWFIYRRGVAEKKKGFDFAVKAFELQQSPASMLEIILLASSVAELRPEVQKFCENYLRRFEENKTQWVEEDGFRDRVEAGRLACFYLGNIAKINNDKKLVSFYIEQQNMFVEELIRLSQSKRW